MTPPRRLELRCFCRRETLLAICNRHPRTGKWYLHIKHRQGTGAAEVLVSSGVLRLNCWACTRWHTVRMQDENVQFQRASDAPDLPLPRT